jgi:hypothetical protein
LLDKIRRATNGVAELTIVKEILSAHFVSILDDSFAQAEHLQAIEGKLTTSAQAYLDSGQLGDTLNDAFHGSCQSYLSLSSATQHIADSAAFEGTEDQFKSVWEALLFNGVVGYPIALQRPLMQYK